MYLSYQEISNMVRSIVKRSQDRINQELPGNWKVTVNIIVKLTDDTDPNSAEIYCTPYMFGQEGIPVEIYYPVDHDEDKEQFLDNDFRFRPLDSEEDTLNNLIKCFKQYIEHSKNPS